MCNFTYVQNTSILTIKKHYLWLLSNHRSVIYEYSLITVTWNNIIFWSWLSEIKYFLIWKSEIKLFWDNKSMSDVRSNVLLERFSKTVCPPGLWESGCTGHRTVFLLKHTALTLDNNQQTHQAMPKVMSSTNTSSYAQSHVIINRTTLIISVNSVIKNRIHTFKKMLMV